MLSVYKTTSNLIKILGSLFVLALFCLFLFGCQTEDTGSKKVEATFKEHKTTDNKGKFSFDGVTPDIISPKASGNSTIHITIGEKKKTIISEEKDEKSEDDISKSFSLDETWSKTRGWRGIGFLCLALLIWQIRKFLNKTRTGKAMDFAGGEVIKYINKQVHATKDQLSEVNVGTSEHVMLQRQLNGLKDQLTKKQERTVPQKKFWQ